MVNYAEKYSDVIDEQFKIGSITHIAVNTDYEFDGVNKVSVYSTHTVPLNDYNLAANANRYGAPSELGNDVQVMTLTQDKSFTFTIDRRNYDDTMLANSAALALKREVDIVIIPTIDKYRIQKLYENAGTVIEQEITGGRAYSSFLDASAALVDFKIPVAERIAFVSPVFYKQIKLDEHFTSTGDKAHDLARIGIVGTIDNTQIALVPTEYLPPDVSYIITHPSAMPAPIKLSDYKIHDKPQGINGWLVEGRIYFDAFVLKNKRLAVFVSKAPTYAATFTVKSGGTNIEGATITIGGKSAATAASGQAVLQLASGNHIFTVTKNGYKPYTATVAVDAAPAAQAVSLTAQ